MAYCELIKSFTDRDIMLHFQLLDILPKSEGLPIFEIMEELADRLNAFDEGNAPDESTAHKKLTEYEKLGLVTKTRRGWETVYYVLEEPMFLTEKVLGQ